MPPSEQSRWFSEQVLPYEPALRAYLLKRFPSLPDHDDLVQETYMRLLRAKENGRLTYAKAFLFTAARNAAIDLFRRRQTVRHEELGAHAGWHGPDGRAGSNDRCVRGQPQTVGRFA